jgi:hypothetical protein
LSDRAHLDGRSFALGGPMRIVDPSHTPVRGDLADIRLAGRYFVPHYAVAVTHRVAPGAVLRKAAREDAEALDRLDGGAPFRVLDIAGSWAWGQVGEDGLGGYLPLAVLEAA